ncbi:DUF1675 domain-containing protein [Cephalotus follicularis]|uniref:Ninja-family protein n=1 Tax=Cephalotus follicularis TaxID=3775 RepID=A0A1Q3CVG8_CEPFO|nr:DUF1675 domain-containing protein [Cephalotus follicularis]
MSEAKEKRRREMHNLSLEIDKYPRDLLQRLMSSGKHKAETQVEEDEEEEEDDEDTEEIELNLGLSLGGRFGVDKSAKKKLRRSSSVSSTISILREDEDATSTPPNPSLMRTSSLPTETEEEWRKRKQLQTLRRMEAKRRRTEKQRNSSSRMEEDMGGPQFPGLAVGPAFWAAGGRGGFYGQPCSQGSTESQGGSSSVLSTETESRALQGSSSCGEARSPAGSQSLQDRSNQEVVGSSGTKASENACRSYRSEMEKQPDSAERKGREIGMKELADMPCVFTKGDGPNGRRIEGILYKYGRGEEVRIVCVCHGSFLTPAEFVKHAGGGDVDHPLRHIVVNPSATPFL